MEHHAGRSVRIAPKSEMERHLNEDHFHKEVNDDIERRLADIPDSDSEEAMLDLLIGVVRAHVAEVY